ncbi:hypothetical protein TNCV_716561 [Trichonephila clavipes]|nr:hypothetical protein TNCV_716561 [Trichonephila clavipes]
MADKDILEFVQSSKNSIDTDFENETAMINIAPDPTSYEMENIMKSMRNYLDARFDGEMNNKITSNNLMLKETMQRKVPYHVP